MPSKHSKNLRPIYTAHEKAKAAMGTMSARLSSDSQLAFGYCPLSLVPIEECVVTPSGHLYNREAILEYLLKKTRDIKDQAELYRQQQDDKLAEQAAQAKDEQAKSLATFVESVDGVSSILKRKGDLVVDDSTEALASQQRKKLLDDTSRQQQLDDLKRVSPWIPQFTPSASQTEIKEPPKRPPSPFSGRPLRAKDLIPIDLVREGDAAEQQERQGQAGVVRFICPVSRKTITTQKVILIKSTHTYMTEDAAKKLAYTDMVCPLTGKPFIMDDVVELVTAASGFASSGQVIATKYRPSI